MIAFWVVAGVLTALAAGLILARAARAAATAGAPDPTAVVNRRQLVAVRSMGGLLLIAMVIATVLVAVFLSVSAAIILWLVVLLVAAVGWLFVGATRVGVSAVSLDPTALVYRRQLAEIDDLADRGLIAESERKGAHAEAARRLLSAAEHPDAAWTEDAASRRPVLVAVLAASAVALGLYVVVGSPGAHDQPFARRLAQWKASDPRTLNPPELAALLQQVMRTKPDPEGYRYLAIAQGAAQNPAEAVRAMRHAVKLAPQRADLWEMLGEALIFQSGGDVSADAQAAFREALKRDPKSVAARFHLARAQVASGDKAAGIAGWRALLADLPADDPRRAALQSAITEAENGPAAAPATPGLNPEQLAAVRGMVEGLATRLQTKPDDPEGWVRLVRAYSVLGDTKKRDDALAQARTRYAGRPEVLQQLDAAAAAEPMK